MNMNKPKYFKAEDYSATINFTNRTNQNNNQYQQLFLKLTMITKAILGIRDRWELNISFLDPVDQLNLNQIYRKKNYVADVLSFPIGITEEMQKNLKFNPIGDIAFCPQKIIEQAEAKGHNFEQELVILFIHGILHVLGYDHEKDKDYAIMNNLELLIQKQVEFTTQK